MTGRHTAAAWRLPPRRTTAGYGADRLPLERRLCVPVFFRQKPLVSGLDARFIHACSACVGAFIGAAYVGAETPVNRSAATTAAVVFANIIGSSFLLTYIKAADKKSPLYL